MAALLLPVSPTRLPRRVLARAGVLLLEEDDDEPLAPSIENEISLSAIDKTPDFRETMMIS
jgi:hypothetical protein